MSQHEQDQEQPTPFIQPRVPPPTGDGGAGSAEVEAWLKSRGVNFLRCMDIPISNFDEKASRTNQARPQAVVAEAVDRYTLAMKAGQKLPPLVAYRTSERSTTLIIVDGNNRHAAAKKSGVTKLPTYVLASDTPTSLIYLLTVEANARHGQPVPTEWRVKQALHLLEVGWPLETACEAAGIPVSTVKLHKAVAEIDARVRPLKITGWMDQSATSRHKLGQVKLDAVLFQAARLVIDTEMTTAEVTNLVRDVKTTRSQDEAFAIIERQSAERHAELEERRKLQRKPRTISNVQQSLVTALGKVQAVDAAAVMRLTLTDLERQRLWDRLDKAAEKIFELQTQLEVMIKGGHGGTANAG